MSQSSVKAKLVMAQSFAAFMDSGANSATIIFYEGEIPANTESAANPDKELATLVFPDPCFKEATATYVELHPTNTATVTKAGVATWARLLNGAGEAVADFTVGADIELANPELVLGSTLMMNSLILKPST